MCSGLRGSADSQPSLIQCALLPVLFLTEMQVYGFTVVEQVTNAELLNKVSDFRMQVSAHGRLHPSQGIDTEPRGTLTTRDRTWKMGGAARAAVDRHAL